MRVSVVIPVRDGERYLMAALDSVLVQDPRPDEMIVVDDGSTDDTAALLTERSAPVRSVRQEPRGQAAALNRGIEESTGDILGFCDADDLWAPGKQARQLAVLRSDPECDGVFGLVQQFVSDELDRAAGFSHAGDEPLAARLLASTLIRREVFDRVGSFDEALRHGANIDWMSRASQLGVRFVALGDVVVHRRLHESNMGLLEQERARADLLEAMRRDRHRRVHNGHASGTSAGPMTAPR